VDARHQQARGAAEPGSLTGGVPGVDRIDPTLEAGGILLALGGSVRDAFDLLTLSPDDTEVAQAFMQVAVRKRHEWNEDLVDDLILRLSSAREPRQGS
jgi:hypothetical protein